MLAICYEHSMVSKHLIYSWIYGNYITLIALLECMTVILGSIDLIPSTA